MSQGGRPHHEGRPGRPWDAARDAPTPAICTLLGDLARNVAEQRDLGISLDTHLLMIRDARLDPDIEVWATQIARRIWTDSATWTPAVAQGLYVDMCRQAMRRSPNG